MILLAAALKEPSAWDGVVLMGPLIHIDPALASPVKLWAARILSRVTPQLAVYNQLKFLFRQKETVINSEYFYRCVFLSVHRLVLLRWKILPETKICRMPSKTTRSFLREASNANGSVIFYHFLGLIF